MNTLTLTGTAFALAMDAFAVSVAVAFTLSSLTYRHIFRLSWHFGFFQALMTVAGWSLGTGISTFIGTVGNWLACTILCLLGARMIWQSGSPESINPKDDPTRGKSLIGLSLATSMDALAVGVSLALINISIWIPAIVIGVTALFCTLIGIAIGRHAGYFIGSWAERVGGIVLIGVGWILLF